MTAPNIDSAEMARWRQQKCTIARQLITSHSIELRHPSKPPEQFGRGSLPSLQSKMIGLLNSDPDYAIYRAKRGEEMEIADEVPPRPGYYKQNAKPTAVESPGQVAAQPTPPDNTSREVRAEPQAPRPRPHLATVRASEIQPQKIQWLWSDRFALGKFSLIAGNPGLGKSQLTVHMAAQVSRGGAWPNNEGRAPHGSVIVLSCEDDAADTLVPRLHAAGADLDRIHIAEAIRVPTANGSAERQFNLAEDVSHLCDVIDKIGDVRLVIIDPVTAYLGTGKNVDSHKNSEVRAALAPLQAKAAKLGFAAIGITHLNKGGGTEALMRVIGSLAFTAASRVSYLVVGDTDNQRTLFIPMKTNIGVKRPGLAFRIVSKVIDDGIDTSAVEWDLDEITTTADEALAAAAGKQGGGDDGAQGSVGEAMNFIRDLLAGGPLSAKVVEHQAKEAAITKATLRRAKKALGVKARHRGYSGSGGHGEWVWEMPEQITLHRSDIGD